MRNTIQSIINSRFVAQNPTSACYAEATIQHTLGIELYKRLNIESVLEKKIPGRNEYLDILIEHKDICYGIELKYKTKRVKDVRFEYTSHGAQNNGRYDFVWDIYRLEQYCAQGIINRGFAVFMTNDKSYWSICRSGSGVAPFDLSDNQILHGSLIPGWADRTKPIHLKGAYPLKWYPALKDANDVVQFRYLLIEVATKDK